MRKLILHIGTHKTGTSSIQETLHENNELLGSKDWIYFCAGKGGKVCSIEPNCNSWVNFIGDKHTFEAGLDTAFYDELSKLDNTKNVIVSSEELSFIFSSRVINNIKKELSKIFDLIEIVVYFRRQDDFLISHYQQGFRAFNSTAAKFYGRSLSPTPNFNEYFDKYLDYNHKVKIWSESFGEKNIIVRWFDKNTMHNGDPSSDFFNILGLNVPKSNSNKTVNIGLNKYQLLNNYCFLQFEGKASYYLMNFFSKGLAEQGNIKYLPSFDEGKMIMDRYCSSNAELFDKANINEVIEYRAYPEVSTDYNEKDIVLLYNNFIASLLKIPVLLLAKVFILKVLGK
ncbi:MULTISPECIES: hypothetical protein [unclassified Pseudoalteromonas]|uniref:hypothetical protein n=1 Tax=unclassified Pseudoalteromonas TaxID=194690 RepID=UPI00040237FE|nr:MULTISPECIES: hypothetical protein [unclassified Pseudoalteromonas]